MNFLLDTNVISELVTTKPNTRVIKWLEQVPITSTYLSVLSLGEIRKGIEKMSDKNRKLKLLIWLENDLMQIFSSRMISISPEVADRWGRLLVQVNRTLPAIDSLLAASALHHDLTLVTRNAKDFEGCSGLEVINPWENY